jgi:drug/metabolite transporter (DMT)-like permease
MVSFVGIGQLHPFEITFFRSAFGFAAFAPLFIGHGWAPFRTKRLGLHAVRGVLTSIAILTLFWGLSMTELAKVQALSFTTPLFAAVLGFALLRERVPFVRIAALLVGFAGAVVVLRPGMIEIGPGPILIPISALVIGGQMITMKVLSRTESSTTVTLYMMVFTTISSFIAAIFVWKTPTWPQLGVMAAIGFLSAFLHLCMAQAIKEADISVVLSVNYAALIWAAIIGFAVFAEIPDIGTWVGGTIISAAVVFIAVREKMAGPQTHSAPSK